MEGLRGLVGGCLGMQLYRSAEFFADKLACSTANAEDILLLAETYASTKQWRRALHLLQQHELIATDLRALHLAAKCLVLLAQVSLNTCRPKQEIGKDVWT